MGSRMRKRMSNFAPSVKAIKKAKTIAISGHANPDGDSLGSLLALGLGLESLGKKVFMLCQDELPASYKLLPGADRLVKTLRNKVDLAIAVDCSMIDVIEKNVRVFEEAKKILEIDHHDFRKAFGDIHLINNDAAAVGELVYELLNRLGVKLTKNIAKNLLTSIIVETNLFRVGKIRPFTFRLCAELVDKGIDFMRFSNMVYGPRSKEAVMLSAICLARARFLKHGKVIWSVLRRKDFSRVRGKYYDSDAIANEMQAIKGVEVVVLFKQKERHMLRVSLRSRGRVNVGRIAQARGGGGHYDIAGFNAPNTSRAMNEVLGLIARAV
jgi:bifunctional oligoribonuclease and PAP phosphatase NrnA